MVFEEMCVSECRNTLFEYIFVSQCASLLACLWLDVYVDMRIYVYRHVYPHAFE